jgi:hypothetical protein
MRPILYAGPVLLLLGGILGGMVFNTNNPAQALSPAQSYDLSWSTIDGGGHTFSTQAAGESIYLPLVLKGFP